MGVNGELTGEKVAPGDKVDFRSTDGNIKITRVGTDLEFALSNDMDKDLTNKGLNFSDSQGDVVHRDLGQKLGIVGANRNITTRVNAGTGSVEIALSDDLDLDSVAINNGGPIINKDGINMNDNRITKVAAGVDDTDAVNVGQLEGGLDGLDKELTTKGLNFADSQGNVVHRDLGETLGIVGVNDNVTTRVNTKKVFWKSR